MAGLSGLNLDQKGKLAVEVEIEQKVDKIREIFFPSSRQQLMRVRADRDLRFAHYTSADVALSIIKKKEMWLRNSKTMNDLSEVRHGLVSLAEAYGRESTNQLKEVLNELQPNLQTEIENLFNGHQPNFIENTYLTCVSEHSLSRHSNGRLSMWRAYAPVNGVALVLNTEVFGTSNDILKSYSTPVHYGNADSLATELNLIGKAMAKEIDLLKSFATPHLQSILFNMLHFFVLCTKHPAFAEEVEWRVTHSPRLYSSPHVPPEIESVRGVPQIVHKLPIKNFPDEGLTGLALNELLDHIIVGPSPYGTSIRDALCLALEVAGVDEPAQRVRVADIPLRIG